MNHKFEDAAAEAATISLHDYLCRDRARDIAMAENLDIIEPAANELQLDLDTPDSVKQAYDRIVRFQYDMDCTLEVAQYVSRHGNTHLVIKLPFDIESPYERIAWQACFGSDLTREYLSCMRVLNDIEMPTILFRRKGASNEPNDK